MAGNPPPDGRLPSFPLLGAPLVGSELMYIVSPGNNLAGVSYSISTTTLAGFFSAFPFLNTTLITSGATYNALVTDTTILVDKTIGSATSIVMPAALTMLYPFGVLIKDAKGDSGTNPITIIFNGIEKCDGLSSLVINNPYGFIKINPIPGQSAWYQSQ